MRAMSGLVLNDRFFFALLVALALVKGTLYSVVVPPWQAPDEPKHFEYVRLLHEKGRLVYPSDASPSIQRELIQSMAQFDYWRFFWRPQPTVLPTTFEQVWGDQSSVLGSPPLPYLFSLPVFELVSNSDLAEQLYALRSVNVLLSALVVILAFLLAKALFPADTAMKMALPLFILFMPMYSFIAGSYTNQVMADLAAALSLYLMVIGLKKGLSLFSVMALLGTMAMAYVSKRTSLFVIPLSFLYLSLRMSRRIHLLRALGIALLVLTGLAIVLVLVASLPTGLRGLRWVLLDRYFWVSFESFARQLAAHDYFSYAYRYLLVKYFQTLFESFWGVFGWMTIRLDAVWYWLLLVLGIASAVGLGLTLLSRSAANSLTQWQRNAVLLCMAAVVMAVAPIIALYSSQFTPFAMPQGRYLFPVIIPISLLMTLGLRRLVPNPLVRMYPFLLVTLMFLFDTASLVLYIMPYYYGTR